MTGSESADGALGLAIGTYLIWGLLTLFWPLLEPANALEILANRLLWSFVTAALVLVALRADWRWVRAALTGRSLVIVLLASALIGINWGLYIWAVNNGHVVDASLGYYLSPLLSVLLGVLFLGERTSRRGWLAIGLTSCGVLVAMAGSAAGLPIALGLAASFSLYGLVKKYARLTPLQGLFLESALLAPVGLGYLIWAGAAGHRLLFGSSLGESVLLALTGLVTLAPLLMFARAAPGLPLGVLGILQYLLPTIQFLLGIMVFSQTIDGRQWAGFGLVWLGSIAYLTVILRSGRRDRPGRPAEVTLGQKDPAAVR